MHFSSVWVASSKIAKFESALVISWLVFLITPMEMMNGAWRADFRTIG